MAEIAMQESELFSEVSRLIRESHRRVATVVNAEMTELYWQVGNTINQKVLGGERAEYGADVVKGLSEKLTDAYGRGWGVQHLRHCMRLARTFPHDEKFYALRREWSWTSIRTLSYIENPVELMGLDAGNIRVAEYLTQLPDQDVLKEKLRLSVERARKRIERESD